MKKLIKAAIIGVLRTRKRYDQQNIDETLRHEIFVFQCNNSQTTNYSDHLLMAYSSFAFPLDENMGDEAN